MNHYLVKPDQTIHLDEWDAKDKQLCPEGKKEGMTRLKALNEELEILQERLYAEHKHRVLIVLQGMDTSGKDGTIRHVFEGVNPQGVKVASFKVPSELEMDHDYLWRVHQKTPGNGQIMIFNRSHYEDVLVVRVHELVKPDVWQKRYDHINQFEKILADEGTTILKFFLHISKEEQKERLQERLDNPDKHWKFSSGDVKERNYWKDYQKAYEDVLNRTSTAWAPWYIIPADRKWYRNLLIGSIMVETLKSLKIKLPKGEEGLDKIVIE